MTEQAEEYNKNFDISMWKKVIKYILVQWKYLVLLFLSLIVLSGLEAITPLLTRYAIDTYIKTQTTDNMYWFAIVYFIITLIKAISIFSLIYLC